MCGFVGFSRGGEEVLWDMLQSINHRGPDSSGVFMGADVSLGMCRLSTIGLDDGLQPMFNEGSSVVIVYNGEIYGFGELKEELTQKGHVFKTRSDTEVLIHAYEEFSDAFVKRLRGMFAFAIYDIPKKRVLIGRDFFGIKPLYYYFSDGVFIFGSEIKAFLRHPEFKKELNEGALVNYLTFQYNPLDETFFKGVRKLAPGHLLVYEGGQISVSRYFEADFEPQQTAIEQAADAIDEAVQKSVELHCVSDVEVGSFLSSGVDSSYVAACLKGGKTFTVGFDYHAVSGRTLPKPRNVRPAEYSEISYAKDLAEKLGLEHYSEILSADEFWEKLPNIQYHMDEPLADPAAAALYFVSRLAARHVKVALSGEGADEFFGGYNIYKEPLDLRPLTRLPRPLRRLLGRIAAALPFKFKGKNFLIRGSKSLEERFVGNALIFSERERRKILKGGQIGPSPHDITAPLYERHKNHDDITKMQLLDINFWMVGDILLKADKMSMAHSLEVRVPLLDKGVFEVASKLPTGLRVSKAGTKLAFRAAAVRHLPKRTADKKKLGFPVPIRLWLLDNKYYQIVLGYFTNDTAAKFFETQELVKLLNAHRKGKGDYSRKIWTVFTFLLWHEQFFG